MEACGCARVFRSTTIAPMDRSAWTTLRLARMIAACSAARHPAGVGRRRQLAPTEATSAHCPRLLNRSQLFIDIDHLQCVLKALSGRELLVRRQGLEPRTR